MRPSIGVPQCAGMAQVVDDPIQAGREAVQRRAWKEAYDLFSGADGTLSADDVDLLAESAYWSGRLEEALALRERAYKAHLDVGDKRRAAGIALRLSVDYMTKAALPLASGWLAKGERLLEDEPESLEHGQAELGRSLYTELMGKLNESLAHAERAFEIGKRFADANLQALALVSQGNALIYKGELDRGLALLDEGSTSAISGELDPFSACVVYCMTISSAHGIGDFERARQWTDEANRWADAQDAHGFPGACRVHRSEILWLGGFWEEAEREAVSACDEVKSYNVYVTAAGYYQIGEIRRRRGDFAAAEEAYRKAHELGREPQPGQALLRLAQGNVAEAVAGLKRSLGDEGKDPLMRARRLPAQVDVSLAVGALEAARAAAAELEEIADRFRVNGQRTPLIDGALQLARGRIAVAEDEWDAAEACARAALAIWTRVGAPYEASAARLILGMAYEHKGDRQGARTEYEAAKATFERLGAVLDAQRAMELLGDDDTRRTFLFTDIVDSTKLLDALGDAKWNKLLDRHDGLVKEAIEDQGGEVIKHTGDGFFAAFGSPAAAVEAAVRVQRALEDEPVRVRIGLHSGEALERGSDYAGRGVNVAARIGALAGGGEILVSSETLDRAPVAHPLSAPRIVELKGFEEAVPIAAIGWR